MGYLITFNDNAIKLRTIGVHAFQGVQAGLFLFFVVVWGGVGAHN